MKRLALTAAITLALTACGSSEPAPEVLAQVGDVVITTDQYQHELELRAAMRPGYYELAENREELLQFLVNHQVQLNAARRAGIPEEREFKDLYERMLIQRLRETRLEAALDELAISDADILEFYEANTDQFSRPERRQVALVRISRSAREDEETLQALRDRAAAARQAALELPEETGHFGAVAVEFSDDRGSRYQGGVVGWLVDSDRSQYRLPQEVIDTAFGLASAGEISPVIETDQAFWLVRMVELDPSRQQPLAQVRDGILHRLTRQRAQALETGLIDNLRSEETIVLNEALLDTIPIPPAIPPEREAAPEDRRPPPLSGGSAAIDDSGSAEN